MLASKITKSDIIPIKKQSNKLIHEYSSKQNIFDPFKSSPPNEFMRKLQMRMNSYDVYLDKNEYNRDNE